MQIAASDEGAFRALFQRYQPQLMPFIRKLVHLIGDPQEVMQEVFLNIWQHRRKLDTIENPKGYIVRIVSERSSQFASTGGSAKPTAEKGHAAKGNTSLTPEQQMALKEIAQLVNDAVEKLPKGRRLIYLMSRDQYKTTREIAQELGISESTVTNQLVKALKAIRNHIQTNGLSAFLTFPVIF